MLCKCGQPALLRSTLCQACSDADPRRTYQRAYMVQKRAADAKRAGQAGSRKALQELARRLGMVR